MTFSLTVVWAARNCCSAGRMKCDCKLNLSLRGRTGEPKLTASCGRTASITPVAFVSARGQICMRFDYYDRPKRIRTFCNLRPGCLLAIAGAALPGWRARCRVKLLAWYAAPVVWSCVDITVGAGLVTPANAADRTGITLSGATGRGSLRSRSRAVTRIEFCASSW